MTAVRREQLLSYAVLIVFAIIAIYPIVSIVLLALHKRSDLVTGFSIPDTLDFGTFKTAWQEGALGRGLINSFIVAGTVTVVSAVLSTFAGYAFGAMRFRGSDLLFYLLLLGLIFPYEATVIPLYYIFKRRRADRQPVGADPPPDRPLGPVRHVLDARVLPLDARVRSSRRRGWTARRAS